MFLVYQIPQACRYGGIVSTKMNITELIVLSSGENISLSIQQNVTIFNSSPESLLRIFLGDRRDRTLSHLTKICFRIISRTWRWIFSPFNGFFCSVYIDVFLNLSYLIIYLHETLILVYRTLERPAREPS